MRAIRSHVAGDPDAPDSLRLDDIPDPIPRAGEVLVRVHAAALNFPDLLIIQDKYQFRPQRPFIPGNEAAGIVEAIGPGVANFKPGDRVIASALQGMLAEKVCVAERFCTAIRGGASDDEAASLLITYGTCHYAFQELAQLKAGERVLVLGAAGGVGLAAVQLAKAAGAFVIGCAASPERAAVATEAGADAVVVYPRDMTTDAAKAFTNAIREAAPGKEIDVIMDPVGGPYAEPAFRAMAWGGRHLVVGFTAGIPKMPLNLALLKGASLMGVFYGAFRDAYPERCGALHAELAAMLAQGVIKPVIGLRVPMDGVRTGFKALQDRSVIGKIVVTM